jgi:OHCU decarboxylase
LNAELKKLNAMPAAEAEAALFDCCGSKQWARRMTKRRPFDDSKKLFEAADRIWWALPREDWLEAFRAHPKIGERVAKKRGDSQAQAWSQQEQAATAAAPAGIQRELAAFNRAYADRFGYIFIVCATGKKSEEMLALLRQRLQNDPVAELRIAAEEQRRITRIRLEKMLQTGERP